MRTLTCIVLACLTAACPLWGGDAPLSDDLGPEGNAILKPLVRVRTASAGGSGTVIYSEDRAGSGEYRTFVLTNWHVVSDAIHVVRKWDSATSSWRYVEENDRVQVEVFLYLRGGRTVIGQPIPADIVAHEEDEDLAVLELDYPVAVPDVARLFPAGAELRLLQDVVAVGCSLGADPMVTRGHVNDLEYLIERRAYVMASADIIFGNSGGAVFTRVDGVYHFCGVPSRVTVSYGNAVTHMGFFVPPARIRGWIERQGLTFLLEADVTPEAAFAAREERRREAAGGEAEKGR